MYLIVYSQAADFEVLFAFKEGRFKAYTKMEEVCGEGIESEPTRDSLPARPK